MLMGELRGGDVETMDMCSGMRAGQIEKPSTRADQQVSNGMYGIISRLPITTCNVRDICTLIYDYARMQEISELSPPHPVLKVQARAL